MVLGVGVVHQDALGAALDGAACLSRRRWVVPVHLSVGAAYDALWRRPGMLHRFVFAFHYLHDLAQQLLILTIDFKLSLAVVGISEKLHVRVPLGTGLIDGLLHVGDIVDHVLVVLRQDEHLGHVAVVVDAVLLRR